MCVWVPSAQAREGALGVVTSLAEDGGDLCAGMGHGCIALLHAVAVVNAGVFAVMRFLY